MSKDLFKDFPPVTIEAWESQISIELKGADYTQQAHRLRQIMMEAGFRIPGEMAIVTPVSPPLQKPEPLRELWSTWSPFLRDSHSTSQPRENSLKQKPPCSRRWL